MNHRSHGVPLAYGCIVPLHAASVTLQNDREIGTRSGATRKSGVTWRRTTYKAQHYMAYSHMATVALSICTTTKQKQKLE
jgi:hypothetical protein